MQACMEDAWLRVYACMYNIYEQKFYDLGDNKKNTGFL